MWLFSYDYAEVVEKEMSKLTEWKHIREETVISDILKKCLNTMFMGLDFTLGNNFIYWGRQVCFVSLITAYEWINHY